MRNATVAAFALALAACSSTDSMPGTYLGKFSISATLDTNDCGSGTGAPASETFDIELSLQDSTLYWRQDGDTVNATLDSNNHATFQGSYTGEPEDARSAKCSVVRADTTDITLDSKTTPSKLTGTIKFVYSVVSGFDCSDDLSSNGGAWTQLPCGISYTFTGAKE
jgi:hypothetical protein